MKNQRMERLRLQSIRSARECKRQFKDGVLERHWFPEFDRDSLSWWTDFMIRIGRRNVNVAWRHPRNEYQSLVEEAARKSVEHLYVPRVKDTGNFYDSFIPKYKKVGRSRKKVSSYLSKDCQPAHKAWRDALTSVESRVSMEGRFSVQPSIKIEWFGWCRYVTICAPIEIRCHAEVLQAAELVRNLLSGKTSLNNVFPDYAYTFDQWNAEGLADKRLGLHSMGVAL